MSQSQFNIAIISHILSIFSIKHFAHAGAERQSQKYTDTDTHTHR